MKLSMEKSKSFIQTTDTRNIPASWELLETNRKEKTTTKKRNLPLATRIRLRGPPKVIDGFHNFNVIKNEQYPHVCTQIDVCAIGPNENVRGEKSPKPRPIILQSRQVLGRYFPKPAFPGDDKGLGWDNSGSVSSPKCAMKLSDRLKHSRSYHGPKTATSMRSSSRGCKSMNSAEYRVRYNSEHKNKDNRQVTFPVKRNNLVGFLSGTPKQIHHRHLAIIGVDIEIKTDIFANKLVTVSAS